MSLKAINTVLVRVPKTNKDTIKCGEIELYLDSRFDNVAHTVRYGEVVSSADSRFAEGDIVYFHHNNVRRERQLGNEGKTVESANRIFTDIFPIFQEDIYGYKRGGSFQAIHPYCFVKPVPNTEKEKNGILLVNLKSEEDNIGTVRYGNSELEENGIHEGDTVIFRKYAKYEFHIDDEKLFRMQNDWIIASVKP